ncbi:hypothetical protein PTSG_09152 [Salpingoeca rosetta]|uniref:Uncharacterized protein n=1 Tax=Salpingoeca rosetta (strain ATCC 50818 / BSB-021) TaxID=946362 RepID=F2UMV8_SALR5|nr:uncharacterized protein PTSG_09152 [Salpingoeca rosetta]EGD78457.1 hypothetical protein PTSG_09152 [Salpingoeca rosetta]|eukprot:XP_004989406.1 hypothetical protein PTSG_09152 [Salpingoeca rosetta]
MQRGCETTTGGPPPPNNTGSSGNDVDGGSVKLRQKKKKTRQPRRADEEERSPYRRLSATLDSGDDDLNAIFAEIEAEAHHQQQQQSAQRRGVLSSHHHTHQCPGSDASTTGDEAHHAQSLQRNAPRQRARRRLRRRHKRTSVPIPDSLMEEDEDTDGESACHGNITSSSASDTMDNAMDTDNHQGKGGKLLRERRKQGGDAEHHSSSDHERDRTPSSPPQQQKGNLRRGGSRASFCAAVGRHSSSTSIVSRTASSYVLSRFVPSDHDGDNSEGDGSGYDRDDNDSITFGHDVGAWGEYDNVQEDEDVRDAAVVREAAGVSGFDDADDADDDDDDEEARVAAVFDGALGHDAVHDAYSACDHGRLRRCNAVVVSSDAAADGSGWNQRYDDNHHHHHHRHHGSFDANDTFRYDDNGDGDDVMARFSRCRDSQLSDVAVSPTFERTRTPTAARRPPSSPVTPYTPPSPTPYASPVLRPSTAAPAVATAATAETATAETRRTGAAPTAVETTPATTAEAASYPVVPLPLSPSSSSTATRVCEPTRGRRRRRASSHNSFLDDHDYNVDVHDDDDDDDDTSSGDAIRKHSNDMLASSTAGADMLMRQRSLAGSIIVKNLHVRRKSVNLEHAPLCFPRGVTLADLNLDVDSSGSGGDSVVMKCDGDRDGEGDREQDGDGDDGGVKGAEDGQQEEEEEEEEEEQAGVKRRDGVAGADDASIAAEAEYDRQATNEKPERPINNVNILHGADGADGDDVSSGDEYDDLGSLASAVMMRGRSAQLKRQRGSDGGPVGSADSTGAEDDEDNGEGGEDGPSLPTRVAKTTTAPATPAATTTASTTATTTAAGTDMDEREATTEVPETGTGASTPSIGNSASSTPQASVFASRRQSSQGTRATDDAEADPSMKRLDDLKHGGGLSPSRRRSILSSATMMTHHQQKSSSPRRRSHLVPRRRLSRAISSPSPHPSASPSPSNHHHHSHLHGFNSSSSNSGAFGSGGGGGGVAPKGAMVEMMIPDANECFVAPTPNGTALISAEGQAELIVHFEHGLPKVMAGSTVALIEYLLGQNTNDDDGDSDAEHHTEGRLQGWLPFGVGGDRNHTRAQEAQSSFEEYMKTFLLSFRLFVTPETLVQVLLNQMQQSSSVRVLRRRVLEILQSWINTAWRDFYKDPSLVSTATQILATAASVDGHMSDLVPTIQSSLHQRLLEDKSERAREQQQPDDANLPKISLIVTDPEDLAEQLTLFNARLYQRVDAIDLIESVVQNVTSKPLSRVINRFDEEYFWVEQEVLDAGDPKLQAVIIDKFIQAAAHCKALNNFYSVFTIIGALDTAKIRKLKQAWDGVPKESRKLMQRLQSLTSTDKNMKAYRSAYKKLASKAPRVAFLPIVMKDLRFIADGNQKKVQGLLNFDRLRALSEYASHTEREVSIPYKKLTLDDAMQRYLKHQGDAVRVRLRSSGLADAQASTEREQALQMQVAELASVLEERDAQLTKLQQGSSARIHDLEQQLAKTRRVFAEEKQALSQHVRTLQRQLKQAQHGRQQQPVVDNSSNNNTPDSAHDVFSFNEDTNNNNNGTTSSGRNSRPTTAETTLGFDDMNDSTDGDGESGAASDASPSSSRPSSPRSISMRIRRSSSLRRMKRQLSRSKSNLTSIPEHTHTHAEQQGGDDGGEGDHGNGTPDRNGGHNVHRRGGGARMATTQAAVDTALLLVNGEDALGESSVDDHDDGADDGRNLRSTRTRRALADVVEEAEAEEGEGEEEGKRGKEGELGKVQVGKTGCEHLPLKAALNTTGNSANDDASDAEEDDLITPPVSDASAHTVTNTASNTRPAPPNTSASSEGDASKAAALSTPLQESAPVATPQTAQQQQQQQRSHACKPPLLRNPSFLVQEYDRLLAQNMLLLERVSVLEQRLAHEGDGSVNACGKNNDNNARMAVPPMLTQRGGSAVLLVAQALKAREAAQGHHETHPDTSSQCVDDGDGGGDDDDDAHARQRFEDEVAALVEFVESGMDGYGGDNDGDESNDDGFNDQIGGGGGDGDDVADRSGAADTCATLKLSTGQRIRFLPDDDNVIAVLTDNDDDDVDTDGEESSDASATLTNDARRHGDAAVRQLDSLQEADVRRIARDALRENEVLRSCLLPLDSTWSEDTLHDEWDAAKDIARHFLHTTRDSSPSQTRLFTDFLLAHSSGDGGDAEE